jgi:protein SCO1/2
MLKLYAGIAVAAIVAAVGGTLAYTLLNTPDDQFAECRATSVAGGPGDIGGPFTLVNAEGTTVTDVDVITGPTLVYFGYTFCPDVCPFDMARNALAVDILEEMGLEVTPVFISIDPDRDTPEAVGNFAANLHPRAIGLTGSPEQVKAASQAYKTYYRKQDSEDEFYLVDHSTFTYLVLPEAGFVEFYRRDTTPEDMAESVACFVNAA